MTDDLLLEILERAANEADPEYAETNALIDRSPHFDCPIQCGDCCYTPPEAWKPGIEPVHPDGRCTRLTHKGCALRRKKRPNICNSFVCMKAIPLIPNWEFKIRGWLMDEGLVEPSITSFIEFHKTNPGGPIAYDEQHGIDSKDKA